MQAGVLVFPGSNCDRDIARALSDALVRQGVGGDVQMLWHRDPLPRHLDLIVVPGGFTYGDYLRAGAIAAHSPIMRDVVARAGSGVPTLGVCNGFQVLCEAGLLPGALLRNRDLRFICKTAWVSVASSDTPYTRHYRTGRVLGLPLAHNEGNYVALPENLERIEGEGRVAFRYSQADGTIDAAGNPNGSANNIAGITDPTGRILGLMPHPERRCEPSQGSTDGAGLFDSAVEALA